MIWRKNLAWKILIDEGFEKDLKKLDRETQKRIISFLKTRLAKLDNPRQLGKPLQGSLGVFWHYRIGDYRVICKIENKEMLVLVVTASHRKSIYKKLLLTI